MKEVLAALRDLSDDYRLLARNSFAVRGKLTEKAWKHDDPGGYKLWKRGMKALKATDKRKK